MNKKQYQKPTIEVVEVQTSQFLCQSGAAKGYYGSDGFGWDSDGIDGDDY